MNIISRLMQITNRSWKIGLPILILFSALFSYPGLFVQSARADPAITIKVNTTTDTNTSDDFISLREAILLVNGGTGGDGFVTGLGRSLSTNENNQIIGSVIGPVGVPANIVFAI